MLDKSRTIFLSKFPEDVRTCVRFFACYMYDRQYNFNLSKILNRFELQDAFTLDQRFVPCGGSSFDPVLRVLCLKL